MSVHFFSVLGTSLYEPVVYQFPEKNQTMTEQEFVQIAMLAELQEQLQDDGKISIFLTEGAKKRNWEDRLYNDKDIELSDKWVSAKKQNIQANQTKQGMKTILQEQYPQLYAKTKGIDICNASTEDEIWSVFETLYNTIEEGDEIIFDITHSFRSIPMLAITVINYAKVMKNCTLRGIYYGAYEAAEIKDNMKYAPIVNLTVYNEILDWTNAAEAFMQYGVVTKMLKVYEDKKKTVSLDKKIEWLPIERKIKAMQYLSMAIFTCRGADFREENLRKDKGSAFKKSIKSAYRQLIQQNVEEADIKAKEIKPLYPLLEKIEEKYGKEYFGKEKNFEIGCGVVKWSIQNNMIQQGYTALEETIKTYLCDCYGLPDQTERTRETIVGRTITGINRFILENPNTKFEENREAALQKISSDNAEDAEIIKKIVNTIPVSLTKLCAKVKEKRNDINHFGFRDFPASSTDLANDLKKLYQEFIDFINESENEAVL